MSSATLITDDANWSSRALLLRFRGAEGATSITDDTGKNVVVNGSMVITRERRKFDESSGRFDGVDDALVIGAAADWKFLHDGSNWTIEGWISLRNFSQIRRILDTAAATTLNSGLLIAVTNTRALNVQMYHGVDSSFVINVTYASAWPNDDKFHFLRITYDNSGTPDVLTAYIDGSSLGGSNATNANSTANPPQALYVGKFNHASSTFWAGEFAELRISNGVIESGAVPTDIFPAAQKARYAGTITESLPADTWIVEVHRADTGELVGSESTTDGTYQIDVPYTGPCIVTCRPYQGEVWTANTVVAVGKIVFPTDTIATPYFFRIESGNNGTTGGTEPTWTTPTGTTADGTATWTAVGPLTDFDALRGPFVPA